MRTTILVVPALLTPLATAQPPDKTSDLSSSAPTDGEAKVRNDELADAFQAKKEFAGAVTYVASDYIVCIMYAFMLSPGLVVLTWASHGVDSDLY